MSRSEEETEEFVGDEGGGSKSFLGSNIFFSSLCMALLRWFFWFLFSFFLKFEAFYYVFYVNCEIEKFGPLSPNECETDLRKIGCIKFNWKLDCVFKSFVLPTLSFSSICIFFVLSVSEPIYLFIFLKDCKYACNC